MKCPNCSFEVVDNAKFCPECGTKMLEATTDTTALFEEVEVRSNAPSNAETNEKKKAKKKKLKKIIVFSISTLIACGVIFGAIYLLNPNCIFGHRELDLASKEPTCTNAGKYTYTCNACGVIVKTTYKGSLSHNYVSRTCTLCGKNASCSEVGHEFVERICGTTNTCIRCGKQMKVNHVPAGDSCKYCGKYKYIINFPSVPIEVNVYNNSKNIEQNIRITQIEVKPYYDDDVKVVFTVDRVYHEKGNNHSAKAKFGWKLYAPDGTVVDSGTGYSNASISVGEKSQGEFIIYNLKVWTDYRLEILNLS